MGALENTPAIFSLQGIDRLRVAHPAMQPARTTIANNVPAEFVQGPFAIELTARLHAGQRVTLRIEDAALARSVTAALGHAASALEYALKRTQPILPVAAARVPARPCKEAVPTQDAGAASVGAGAAAGIAGKREYHTRDYWREIFEHWVESNCSLKIFCREVGYDEKKTYGAFTNHFYREFHLQLRALEKKGAAQ